MIGDASESSGPESEDTSESPGKFYEVLGGTLNAIPYSRLSILLGPDPAGKHVSTDTQRTGRLSKRSRRRRKKCSK